MVSSALVLMEEIIRARYNAQRMEHLRGPGQRTATTGTTTAADAARSSATSCCRWCVTFAYVQVAEEEQNLWDEYVHLTCRTPTSTSRCAQATEASARSTPCSAICSRRKGPRRHESAPTPVAPAALPLKGATPAAGKAVPRRSLGALNHNAMKPRLLSLDAPLPLRSVPANTCPATSDWSFELIETYHRTIRATAERYRAGLPTRTSSRSSPPSRLMDAYASRRHAGELPPLVLRQGVHRHREELQARPHGPGLRDRHQQQPLHQLPDGGEHAGDAGPGHRARGLRPQQLLQGQLPVPDVDRCGVDHRLPGLCQELRGLLRRESTASMRSKSLSRFSCHALARTTASTATAAPAARAWRRN